MVICTTPFEVTARNIARVLGIPDYPFTRVQHPIGSCTLPELKERAAASLDGKVSPQAFAPLLAASFARLLDLWRNSDPGLIAHAWLTRAHPPGTRLTVHSGRDETFAGRFDGIERDGALRLRRDDGTLDIVRAGDIEL